MMITQPGAKCWDCYVRVAGVGSAALARRDEVAEKLRGAAVPRVAPALLRARFRRTGRERALDAAPEVGVERAEFVARDDVHRPGDRVRGDRQPARERFDEDDAERVRAAREH